MKFIRQNFDWNADPNSPMPNIEVFESTSILKLTFDLNSFIYDDVDEYDKVVLEF